MNVRVLCCLLLVSSACAKDAATTRPGSAAAVAGKGASTTQVKGGDDVSRALDAYAAELMRGVKVRCELCWKQLGHESAVACHKETDSDLLDDTHRMCFEALAADHRAELTLYLQCQTAASSWFSDCFAKDCDLRRCAVEHASWKPPAQCAVPDDDGGTEPVTGVSQCDPATGTF